MCYKDCVFTCYKSVHDTHMKYGEEIKNVLKQLNLWNYFEIMALSPA